MSFNFKLEDFIPYYVDYDDTSSVYNLPEGNALYYSTILKKEFDELHLEPIEEIKPGELYKQQTFISRFLSPNTLYDRMLVYHGIGSGKCVHPSTVITLHDYNIMTIEEMWENYSGSVIKDDEGGLWSNPIQRIRCLSYDEQKKMPVEGKIVKLYREHVKSKVKRYTFSKGEDLVCTYSHKLYVKKKGFTTNVVKGDIVFYNVSYTTTFEQIVVIDVEEEYYEGYVYDLSVENYFSYVANNVITHNTCVITAVVENALQTQQNIRQAIVLTRNPTLKNDIIGKIAGSCTNFKYNPKDVIIDKKTGKIVDIETKKVIDERTYQKRVKRNIRDTYGVYTFLEFAKQLDGLSDSLMQKEYNNRIIIIDEAHNIKERVKTKEGGINVYKNLHRFLHLVQGCKILLLTATPMKDLPSEIVNTLNLISPLNKQLDKKTFTEEYMGENGFIREKAAVFKDTYLKGIVSYVRSMTENIKAINQGVIDVTDGMKFMKTVLLDMEDFQQSAYIPAFKQESKTLARLNMDEMDIDIEDNDSKENKLWINSRQASLFVFPDGSIGTKGEEKYLISDGVTFKVTSELRKYIEKNGSDNDSKLKQLKTLSIKFYTVIRDILKNTSEKFFVYSNIVSGGGAHLFAAVLELFQFDHLPIPTQKTTVKLSTLEKRKNRYILVTGGLLTANQVDILVDGIFNSVDNLEGDYARVIIGSHVVGEGKSFKHVKNAYILTPYWNSPTTDQAIGRVFRADSHTAFENPADRFVRVYRLAAMPQIELKEKTLFGNSIDIIMYRTSEQKDIKVKSVERLLKEAAIDCALNYGRNVSKKDKPYSRECDYMEVCDYKCDYVDPKYYEKAWVGDRITDTYNLYYAFKELDNIKIAVREAFHKKNAYDFYELFNLIRNEVQDIPVLVLSRALNDMILFNDGIKNRYGFINFLREDRNLYFLVDDPLSSTLYTSYYYGLNPVPETKFSTFDEIIKYQQYSNFGDVLELLIKYQSDGESLYRILDNLPNVLIEQLIQVFLAAKINGREENIELQNEILNKYSRFIAEYPKYYLLNIDKNSVKKLMKTATSYEEWEELSEEEMSKLKEVVKEKISVLQEHPLGYYGIIDPLDPSKLRIVKVREVRLTQKGGVNKNVESSLRGQVCGQGSFQFSGLVQFYYDILKKTKTIDGLLPPKIKILKEYDVDDLMRDSEFKKLKLYEHIRTEIDDRELIEELLNDGPERIKEIFVKVLEKGDKKDKALIPTILAKDLFNFNTLKNILGMMGKTKDDLFREVLNKKFTGYEEEELNDRIRNELNKLPGEEISMLGNLMKLTSTKVCPIVQEWFVKNDLYVEK
jgi:hypothetical protein